MRKAENRGKSTVLLFFSGVLLGLVLGFFISNSINNRQDHLASGEGGEQQEALSDNTGNDSLVIAADPSFKSTSGRKSVKEAIVSENEGIDKVAADVIDTMAINDTALYADTGYRRAEVAVDSILNEYDSINIFVKEGPREKMHNEDIIVASDRLLFTRIVRPDTPDTVDTGLNIDSLLSGNGSSKISGQGNIRVEFWVSPINYSGYMLTGKKLILFGLYEFDSVSILQIYPEGLQMKYKDHIYSLIESADFLPLIPLDTRKE